MTENNTLTAESARAAVAEQMPWLQQALTDLVAFRSVHSTPGLEKDNAGAAQWVTDAFRAEGIPVEPHTTTDGSVSVIGVRDAAEGWPTVLLYSHYDVQPASDVDNWTSSPWSLTERNGRWYGRGAADCKGHVVMHLAVLRALNALIDSGDLDDETATALSSIGIRVVVEGSEERGGYGLEDRCRPTRSSSPPTPSSSPTPATTPWASRPSARPCAARHRSPSDCGLSSSRCTPGSSAARPRTPCSP